jgi:hypothetical protein
MGGMCFLGQILARIILETFLTSVTFRAFNRTQAVFLNRQVIFLTLSKTGNHKVSKNICVHDLTLVLCKVYITNALVL